MPRRFLVNVIMFLIAIALVSVAIPSLHGLAAGAAIFIVFCLISD